MIRGLSALLSSLAAMPSKAQKAQMKAARNAARNARQQAQAAVPVHTGALRASITVKPLPNGAAVQAGKPYAALVELGSLRTPARPYLLPAAQSVQYPLQVFNALKEGLR